MKLISLFEEIFIPTHSCKTKPNYSFLLKNIDLCKKKKFEQLVVLNQPKRLFKRRVQEPPGRLYSTSEYCCASYLIFSEAKGQIYGSRGDQTSDSRAEECQVIICPSLSQKGYLITVFSVIC